MKRLFYALFLIVLVCCGSPDNDRQGRYPWAPLSPAFDSINENMETAFIELAPDSVKMAMLGDMKREAAKHRDNSQIQARTIFWESKILSKMNRTEEAMHGFGRARQLTDSAAYPYDIARIRYEEVCLHHGGPVENYMNARRDLEYYRSVGDSQMVGGMYIYIGALYRELLDTLRTREYFEKADRIFKNSGYSKLRLQNMLNLLNVYKGEKADSILNVINNSPEIKEIHSLYCIALYNSYYYTGKVDYLTRLHAIQSLSPDLATPFPIMQTEAMIANHYMAEGVKTDSAFYYARRSWNAVTDSLPLLSRSESATAMYNMYSKTGQSDSALKYCDLSNSLYIEYLGSAENAEVVAAEKRFEIQQRELLEKNKRKIETMWFVIIAGAIVLAVAGIIGFAALKVKNARLVQSDAQLKLDRASLQMAADKLINKGKDSAMQSVKTIIDDMKSSGKLSAADASSINMELTSFANDRRELEAFRDIFDKLSPDFNKKMHERCPDLSEGLLRLGAYIAIGMKSHQIARMLMIDYGSVMKNRYRLRKKLGLERGESLEATLREFAGR